MERPELLEAGTDAATLIAELANKIWYQHYPSIIGVDQVAYMLDKMYSEPALHEQMTSKNHRFFIVSLKGQPQGFVSVEEKEGHELFINKFYINQEMAGQGIGKAVFEKLISRFQPSVVRLTVNRQNYKAINFYFKCGFVIERVADFDIGDGYVMNDFVMVWKPAP